MRTTAPFEIGTGFALGLTAIAADILLLCRKRLGVTLGWIALGLVALSVLVGLWQATVQFRHTADQAMRAGLIVGAVIAIVIRIGLAGLYAFALVRAHRTLGTSAAAPAPASW
jgi:hypothetical protein